LDERSFTYRSDGKRKKAGEGEWWHDGEEWGILRDIKAASRPSIRDIGSQTSLVKRIEEGGPYIPKRT